VGLYVLALLGIFFLVSIVREALDAQPVFEGWIENQTQREVLIIVLIFLLVMLLILI
jgi:hypothetical protein